MINYRKMRRGFRLKHIFTGIFVSLLCGAAATLGMMTSNVFPFMNQQMLFSAGGFIALLILLFWLAVPLRRGTAKFHSDLLNNLDGITSTENQTRRDSWQAVRDLAYGYLERTAGRFSLGEVKQEYAAVYNVRNRGCREIREALTELANTKDAEPPPTGAPGHVPDPHES